VRFVCEPPRHMRVLDEEITVMCCSLSTIHPTDGLNSREDGVEVAMRTGIDIDLTSHSPKPPLSPLLSPTQQRQHQHIITSSALDNQHQLSQLLLLLSCPPSSTHPLPLTFHLTQHSTRTHQSTQTRSFISQSTMIPPLHLTTITTTIPSHHRYTAPSPLLSFIVPPSIVG